MIYFAKLPLSAPVAIADELHGDAAHWQPHFNTRHYQGEWTVLSLRSPGGRDSSIPDLMGELAYANTPHMRDFPAVATFVHSFRCPVQSVRFLNLKAGAVINPHRDHELAFENGEARLHFPIVTNPQVEFFVEDSRVEMQTGDCWYINANLMHRVRNGGTTDRIHLVVDCVVNTWLCSLFDRAIHLHHANHAASYQQRQVIAELRRQGTPSALALADKLEQNRH